MAGSDLGVGAMANREVSAVPALEHPDAFEGHVEEFGPGSALSWARSSVCIEHQACGVMGGRRECRGVVEHRSSTGVMRLARFA